MKCRHGFHKYTQSMAVCVLSSMLANSTCLHYWDEIRFSKYESLSNVCCVSLLWTQTMPRAINNGNYCQFARCCVHYVGFKMPSHMINHSIIFPQVDTLGIICLKIAATGWFDLSNFSSTNERTRHVIAIYFYAQLFCVNWTRSQTLFF